MIVDTSALLAYFNDREADHAAVAALLGSSAGPLIVSPFVVAELDYLVATRLGFEAELAVLRELSSGAWDLAAIDAADLAAIGDVVERYADQDIGVADASLLILAARHRTTTLATLDRRHFGVLRPMQGGRFTVLP